MKRTKVHAVLCHLITLNLITIMNTEITLPKWLDTLLFDDLGAKYCRSNTDMTVIDWCKEDVLNYLGTYFPRSYTESYCIFSQYLSVNPTLCQQSMIRLFDFGCGTGGEIIGFLLALNEQGNLKVKKVQIVAMDGNQHALRLYEDVLKKVQSFIGGHFEIQSKSSPITIEDFYDLSIIDELYKNKEFDIFLTFKAICEFVTKQQFEQDNAYATILRTFLPKLTPSGIAVLVDVTTYNQVAEEWLPKMLDAGIIAAGGVAVDKNVGYNQAFYVTHSHKQNDISKIAYRIIKNK